MAPKRAIRQGQLVAPFGVGAIMDIGPESFVVTDISRWSSDGLRFIDDSRLEDKLNRRIRTPRAKEDTASVAICRFPKWHFCPKCRRMRRVTSGEDEARGYPVPRCEHCKESEMTPMGFVAVCSEGHIGDVDWHYWAHLGSQGAHGVCSRQGAQLFFETSGQGGGDWAAICVRCSCGASHDFTGLVQVEGPAGMRCEGRQPWVKARANCQSSVWVYRRAASNLHFPQSISALDLAAGQSGDQGGTNLAHAWEGDSTFALIQAAYGVLGLARTCETSRVHIEKFADRNGCTIEAATAALARALAGEDASGTSDEDDDDARTSLQARILGEEWAVLSNASNVAGASLQIRRTLIPTTWPEELRRTISAVSMVRRLREVRALLGFRRLSPSQENQSVSVDLGNKGAGWYPGVEAWGEGIFVQLSEGAVREWELRVQPALDRRLQKLLPRVVGMGWEKELVSPRFLLLHSLSHAIVRRLSFDAGYAASSLRERIYASAQDAMCGILIYTADGDSEGSLGGLVRMGAPERFGRLVTAALLDVAWCSADPVCRETEATGLDGLNAAACHACVLVSETSCSHNNCLLDRRTLVGIGGLEPFFRLERLTVSQEAAREIS